MESSSGQENKAGSNKRKLENVSGETSTGHKHKKSRSSRDHRGDDKGDLIAKDDPQEKVSGGSSRHKRESRKRSHSKPSGGDADAVKSESESKAKETGKGSDYIYL